MVLSVCGPNLCHKMEPELDEEFRILELRAKSITIINNEPEESSGSPNQKVD